MGAKGSKVQEITKDFDVGIKFPDRPVSNGEAKGDGKLQFGTFMSRYIRLQWFMNLVMIVKTIVKPRTGKHLLCLLLMV